ncbi:MAG: leucyl aminopeptidase [Nanoarchaeota archaeon]|nr:leucyl aminopeptidase [Nanoarchaeota archaeon]MBU1031202.1 leucyl aminopeptidase [Nanoarchaeota archaeon]MBU1850336.1 leucyl aminopeptidase [Nanoarchaeota archaeon]
MKINIQEKTVENIPCDILSIFVFEEDFELNLVTNTKIQGEINNFISSKNLKPFDVKVINTLGFLPSKNILLVNLGKRCVCNNDSFRKASSVCAKTARSLYCEKLAFLIHKKFFEKNVFVEVTKAIVEGVILGLYAFDNYKSADKKLKVKELILVVKSKQELLEISQSVKKAEKISLVVNYVRELVNFPSQKVTPTYLSNEAKRLLINKKIKITVLEKKELIKQGLNCLIGVSQGGFEEPKLVIIEYNNSSKKPIAFVGKGITFDSGGLNIKPYLDMMDMKSDMAGAATVLGILKLASELNMKTKIIGVLALAENMPGSNAQKQGDIVTAYNKKTVEIIHTDAEGRLVLADALSYVEKNFKPKEIIDLATLTSGCIVTFGYSAAGLLGNNNNLLEKIKISASNTFERVWELPLWDDYKDRIKSDVADVRNLGKGKGSEASTIIAGAFLEEFVEKTPWAHLDIAGTAWFVEEEFFNPKGATGFGVRLFLDFLEKN